MNMYYYYDLGAAHLKEIDGCRLLATLAEFCGGKPTMATLTIVSLNCITSVAILMQFARNGDVLWPVLASLFVLSALASVFLRSIPMIIGFWYDH